MGIAIIGTGKYLPKRIVTNEDMAKLVDTSDEWITTRTGIKTRHVVENETTWQMGAYAAKDAMAAAGLSPSDIDVVLGTSVTTDYLTPSVACLVANECGINNALCLDINAACAGFTYGLDLARRYLLDDDCKNVLVISAETMSKIVDYTDRATCVLFGDGAGAAIIAKSDKPFYSVFGSDPTGVPHLVARSYVTAHPFLEQQPFDAFADGITETKGHALYQNGKEVYKFATRILPEVVTAACEKAGIRPADLAVIIPHQANLRIITTAASNLGLSLDHFFVNIEKYGNMSSACIPIALNEAIEGGRIKKGDMVCVVGFGGGLVYGACVFEY